ncbi:MAG: stage V sporulation protein E [Candidatus Taylorbacteria bacterium CG11_big_fil_rev_8_21_14_0_20_46_11]|uniref:Probable peptidoglycan glycosyltransferase FtsW n=1 Tax=Candidatus Taylorbacteria bacterium CG11_big_fil_rev_8_21_14_0_20_46_11 TaxID=1975025 RepID=A0A2H0KA75_9BACT|nr:MAG: stage V sporulation protein E [Candidatus Taylorbacteria bacterium CG11_big_fil_rev_8_21_14_0_20_46_11]
MKLRLKHFIAKSPVDSWLLWIIVTITTFGFLIFTSASIGLFAREGAQFGSVAFTRGIAVIGGALVAYIASIVDYKLFRKYSLIILLGAIILTAFVFVPGIGIAHGGAQRWIGIAGLTFQPSEFLKIAFVIYGAAFYASVKDRISTFSYGLLPLLALLGISGGLLLLQPDTDTFVVLFLALLAMFIVGGGRLKHLAIIVVTGIISLTLLVMARPYLMDRLTTFINPATDPLGAGYQIQQSLIAIGSGGVFGKGFGQSIQKFSYLPEPIGDSIFAVAGEEFGFLGASFIILLFLALLLRGLRVGAHAPDTFSGLLSVGVVILICASAFMNIASMLAIIPLSGLPLSFISHGGTALFITLAETGILLNISRHQKA